MCASENRQGYKPLPYVHVNPTGNSAYHGPVHKTKPYLPSSSPSHQAAALARVHLCAPKCHSTTITSSSFTWYHMHLSNRPGPVVAPPCRSSIAVGSMVVRFVSPATSGLVHPVRSSKEHHAPPPPCPQSSPPTRRHLINTKQCVPAGKVSLKAPLLRREEASLICIKIKQTFLMDSCF